VKHIFIATMIGSWEEEYKDLSAVSFAGIGGGGVVFAEGEKSKPEPAKRRVRHPREFQLCLKRLRCRAARPLPAPGVKPMREISKPKGSPSTLDWSRFLANSDTYNTGRSRLHIDLMDAILRWRKICEQNLVERYCSF
jgi:hypothetical protein